MKLRFVLALILVLALQAMAQAPNIAWTHTYGGSDSDEGWCVQQTSDGGYAMLGTTYSYDAGGGDFWFVKTDANGTTEWSHAYGGTGYDEGWRFQQTTDGGYILCGRTAYGAGGGDFWLVKTDASGNVEWTHTYGGTGSDFAECVVQTTDGGYAVGGYTASYGAGSWDFWLVKTDISGNPLWNHTYGGAALDEMNYLIQTSDGGYALAGRTSSFGYGADDFWLVKTDVNGNMLWNRTYGGASGDDDWGVEETSDGGYILGGASLSYSFGGKDMLMVKTDASGNPLWYRHFGGSADDWCNSIHQTWDNGYILAGWTRSFGAISYDLYMVKTDANGNALWNRVLGGTGWDQATTVQHTSDDGYVVLGWTTSSGAGQQDFWLVKTTRDETLPVELLTFNASAAGTAIEVQFSTASETDNAYFEIWRGTSADGEFGKLAQIASQGESATQQDYHFTDQSVEEGQIYWYYLVDVDQNGTRTEHRDRMASATVQGTALATEYSLTAYPNPFNPSTSLSFTLPVAARVKVRVYDSTGRLVRDLVDAGFQAGEHRLSFDGANLPTGVYLARLETGTTTLTHKLLLVK